MAVAQSDTSSRIDWIDSVKGLTIALVVIAQATYGVAASLHEPPIWLTHFSEFAEPFRMPLFFLAAGLFAQSALTQNLRSFLDKKVLHFAYFYLLWSLIEIGLKMGIGHGNHPVGLQNVLLIPIEPFSSLWFIYALAVFFIVVRLTRNVPKPLLFGAALLLYYTPSQTGWVIPDEFGWRFIFFLTGVYAAPTIFHVANWAQTNKVQAFSTAALLFASLFCADFSGLIGVRAITLLMSFAGALACIMTLSALSCTKLVAPLSYLGTHSLYVYLAYFIPMAAVRILAMKLGIDQADLVAFASAAAGIVGPLVMFHYLEKTPLSFLFIRPRFLTLKALFPERPYAART